MPKSHVLCRLEEIPEGGSKGIAVRPDAGYADLILVRTREEVYAYRNRCPHTGAPLEWRPDQFLDYGGEYIQCGIHGALFQIEDGYCLAGPCARQSLEKVEIEVRDGLVIASQTPGRSRD